MESDGIAGGSAKEGQDGSGEFVAVVGRVVGELAPLDVTPEKLDRVELRSVWWQVFDVEARMSGFEGLDDWTAMTGPAVPNEDQPTTNVTEKLADEIGDALLVEVLIGQ